MPVTGVPDGACKEASGLSLHREMTGSDMPGPERAQLRFLLGTQILRERAPGPEPAARRRANRAGQLARDRRLVPGSGLLGIGFSVVVVIVAALNLVLDFDFIESGVSAGAPKYMEWYGAFGLIVTLVWLYLEILRLLSKINGRR